MTGTPSKDRAEAHMAVARELALSSEGIYRAAEFEALARAIAAALATSFAEGMKRERERIADALEAEADSIACSEDAMVVRSNAKLVRADFSYEEAERLDFSEAEGH